jgi:flagellar biosynthesis protein FlhG
LPEFYSSGFGATQDQAAGLRRLLGHTPLRVAAVAGPGATTLTVNLAAALGAAGMDVLVVDENASHGNVADQLGLGTRYELLHALHGDRSLQDAICEAAPGVSVLPAARGARELRRAAHPGKLSDCMRGAGRAPDLVLVDSACGGVSRLLRDTAAGITAIVAGARHSQITAAYSLIKNAARAAGDGRFQIIVNRAGDASEAEAIFRNMSAVAAKHLGVELEYLGWMPNHPQFKLARAARRSVIDAFPAGEAAAAVRRLAQRLREVTTQPVRVSSPAIAGTNTGPAWIPDLSRNVAGHAYDHGFDHTVERAQWPASAAAFS